MKVAFLFKRDSHFKAVKSTALRLCSQYNCEPTFIGIDSKYFPTDKVHSIVHIDIQDLTSLSKYNYVIACLGGYLLNHVITELRDTTTKVISIFPGIVSHYQLDAFISRLNADQVWLNSKADLTLYKKICKIFKINNNGILYGMSWLCLNSCNHTNLTLIKREESAIFFEQTEIANNDSDKKKIVEAINKLVIANSSISFKYKIRDNTEDIYFLALRDYINKMTNVEVVTELSDSNISNAKYYLSISSSALIEGLIEGKKSFIIDYKLMDLDSREFYKGSNIHLKNYKIPTSMQINPAWYDQRVGIPKQEVDLFSVGKNKIYVNSNQRSLSYIILKIIKLIPIYPKMAFLLKSKHKILGFQKSLEYLSFNKNE